MSVTVIRIDELERLVCMTFPQKRRFSAETELARDIARPIVAFVHGGPDPYLDGHFDAWLSGAPTFVSAFQLLNRLCQAGALPPGEYALTRSSLPSLASGRNVQCTPSYHEA